LNIDEDRWIRFLHHIVCGLREAARRINTEPLKSRTQSRPGWFGRAHKGKQSTRYPLERSISQALCEVLRDIRASQSIGAPTASTFDLTRMEFATEEPRSSDIRIGPRAQPTDFMIAVFQDSIDFRVEAKNVLTQGAIKTDYVGSDGLARFNDPNAPYTLERFGGMVAYVMSHDASFWSTLVKTALRDVLPRECIKDTFVASEVVTTTVHERDIDIPLRNIKGRFRTEVLHLVLEFEAQPSLRGPPAIKTARN